MGFFLFLNVEEQITKFLANIQFGQWFVNGSAWCYSRHIASRFFHTDFLHTKNLNQYQLQRYWAVLLIIGDRIHIVDIKTGRVGLVADATLKLPQDFATKQRQLYVYAIAYKTGLLIWGSKMSSFFSEISKAVV